MRQLCRLVTGRMLIALLAVSFSTAGPCASRDCLKVGAASASQASMVAACECCSSNCALPAFTFTATIQKAQPRNSVRAPAGEFSSPARIAPTQFPAEPLWKPTAGLYRESLPLRKAGRPRLCGAGARNQGTEQYPRLAARILRGDVVEVRHVCARQARRPHQPKRSGLRHGWLRLHLVPLSA